MQIYGSVLTHRPKFRQCVSTIKKFIDVVHRMHVVLPWSEIDAFHSVCPRELSDRVELIYHDAVMTTPDGAPRIGALYRFRHRQMQDRMTSQDWTLALDDDCLSLNWIDGQKVNQKNGYYINLKPEDMRVKFENLCRQAANTGYDFVTARLHRGNTDGRARADIKETLRFQRFWGFTKQSPNVFSDEFTVASDYAANAEAVKAAGRLNCLCDMGIQVTMHVAQGQYIPGGRFFGKKQEEIARLLSSAYVNGKPIYIPTKKFGGDIMMNTRNDGPFRVAA
jgi:hypothetical protein